MRTNTNFIQGKILTPLLTFALPVLVALCLQAMYGAVDLLVVGQFGGAADVSAVSTGSQVMQTITSVITGLAMGTTILLGQKIGEKKEKEAGAVIGGAICLFGVLAVIITAVMLLAARPFSTLLHAPAEAFSQTVLYVQICSAGAVFIVAYNVLGSIFRGMGDSRTPLLAVVIACVVNVAGDLLFVAGFHMGTAGAAFSTVLAQGVSVILCVALIRRRGGMPFAFSRSDIRFHKAIILRTLRLGFPIALQDGLVSISFLAVLAIVNGLGVVASAGVGVAEKLCMFIMLVPSAFMQSLSAFVAQNVGAHWQDRARKAMACGMALSLVLGAVLAYFAFFHGAALAGLFARDKQVIEAAAQYLRAYAIDTLLVSFLFCFAGYFNGCGKTTFVMVQGIIGAFAVRIPASLILSKILPVSLFYVGLATPLSTVVQILLCAFYFAYTVHTEKRPGLF